MMDEVLERLRQLERGACKKNSTKFKKPVKNETDAIVAQLAEKLEKSHDKSLMQQQQQASER